MSSFLVTMKTPIWEHFTPTIDVFSAGRDNIWIGKSFHDGVRFSQQIKGISILVVVPRLVDLNCHVNRNSRHCQFAIKKCRLYCLSGSNSFGKRSFAHTSRILQEIRSFTGCILLER